MALAQDAKKYIKPDYAAIGQLTKDKTLSTYYPKLYSRYEHNDTTLTDREFRLLYYGYHFQAPHGAGAVMPAYGDSLKALNNKDELTPADMHLLIHFTKEDLKKNPYDLENLHRLCNFYQMLGANDSLNVYLYKLKMVARTLFSSGDGVSEATAIYVLTANDEYSALHLLGYEYDGGHSSATGHFDYLSVKKNEDGVAGLYFSVKK